MIVLCVVGSLFEGLSGGYIYDADVHRALLQLYGSDNVCLWQLSLWHPLFGKQVEGAHNHGQNKKSSEISLMSFDNLSTAYKSLPANSTIVFDGFALLEAAGGIFDKSKNIFRQDLHHVTFLQYPFSIEPDIPKAMRDICRVQEGESLTRMDLVVGASNCSVKMLRSEYPSVINSVRVDVIEPIARFKGKRLGHLATSSSSCIKFLCVSNTIPRKNILLILVALKAFKDPKQYKNWELSIVANEHSSSNYRKSLTAYIQTNSLPVVWLGEIKSSEEMASLYSAHDVFIHASDVENYCMAASEAVCCGCVILSTAVGEIPIFSRAFKVDNGEGASNALLFEPNDRAMLQGHLEKLLRRDQCFAQKCSTLAISYASDIARGQYDDVFLNEVSFQNRWHEVLQKLTRKNQVRRDKHDLHDPLSIRLSHYYYLVLTLWSSIMVLMYMADNSKSRKGSFYAMCAIWTWLLFGATSFVDMYIFRKSGCLRLTPYILHHTARLFLYGMLYAFPESDYGWNAATLFNVYNAWLSVSVISFGLGDDDVNARIRRPKWWHHADLILYISLVPQRLIMYHRAPQFVLIMAWFMSIVEVGNLINKIIFWQDRNKKKLKTI
jgi:hypothetical protein